MIDVEDTGVVTRVRFAQGTFNALDLELPREFGKQIQELDGST